MVAREIKGHPTTHCPKKILFVDIASCDIEKYNRLLYLRVYILFFFYEKWVIKCKDRLV